MATLTVRDLDDEVRNELRAMAARNGRSMEAEVRAVLSAHVRAQRRPTLLEATEWFRRESGGVELELPVRADAAEIASL